MASIDDSDGEMRYPDSGDEDVAVAGSDGNAGVASNGASADLPQEGLGDELMSCSHGVICAQALTTTANPSPDHGVWGASHITVIDKKIAKGRVWLAAKMTSTSSLDELAKTLLTEYQAHGIITELQPGVFGTVLKKHRGSMHRILNADSTILYGILEGVKSPMKTRTGIYECVKSLFDCSATCIHNIKLDTTPPSKADLESVVEFFKDLSEEDALMEISRAKATKAVQRTAVQHLIVKCYPHLMRLRELNNSANELWTSMRKASDDTSIKHYKDFSALQALMGWTVDVETGETISMSVDEWLSDGHFKRLSLVLLGSAGTGKTPAGESLCSIMAEFAQDDPFHKPFFLKISTVDSLRKVQHLLRPGVPLLLDDITPSVPRGSRPPMSIDEVKHLMNVVSAEACDGRNNDIVLSVDMPRVVTSNASSPRHWCLGLPDVEHLSPSDRLHVCSGSALAIFKRVLFVQVSTPLIERNTRLGHVAGLLDDTARKMRRLLGRE